MFTCTLVFWGARVNIYNQNPDSRTTYSSKELAQKKLNSLYEKFKDNPNYTCCKYTEGEYVSFYSEKLQYQFYACLLELVEVFLSK